MSLKTRSYEAGSCNIGGPEVKRRRIFAIASAIFSVAAIIFIFSEHISRGARLFIFLPLVATVIGWQQTRRKFCLAYGLTGLYNFGTVGDVSHIQDPVLRAADRAMVFKILAQSVLLASASTLLVAIIPQ